MRLLMHGVLTIVCVTGAAVGCRAPEEHPARPVRLGYSAAQFERQQDLEQRLRRSVSTERLSEFHGELTKRTHTSGTPGARAQAEYLRQKLTEFGLDVQVFEYQAYLSLPKELGVDIVSPVAQTLRVTEPPSDLDRDTQSPELGPGYIAYSASGGHTSGNKADDTQLWGRLGCQADKTTEAGTLPDEKLLTEMGNFNEELVKAGVMLAGEGLHPSSKGARVKFSGAKRSAIDGPFPETKELIAGFWIWQVKSKEEAIEWVKRCPNPTGTESEIEIRQLYEDADFGAEFTPELREQEARLRAEIASKQSKP